MVVGFITQGSTIHTSTHYSLASKEKHFTLQKKNVTCHNSYYIFPICIYLYIQSNLPYRSPLSNGHFETRPTNITI